ncbi:bifunctional histidinol-phosphatase/imidazoleglycerol-phosphate dehydratase HisB [Buchnera aphidicola (Ceratoglyphina bambusae)]|uniref:bifunctional histidinol-phosphatase/imidazoleglycerol-phosphate dehydratase HisB n=1 Tax=Buchnera aphidicola TaxID=9 RepID=UPI0031B7F1C1
MKKKFLFIDRDGTIINEPLSDFKIDSINKLKFEKNVFSVLSSFKKKDYHFVIVTNQDGLGTKEFPKEKFNYVNNFIINVFLSQGIKFYDFFICPHYLKENCKCRKPKIGLLKKFIKNNKIDKKNSFVIGDRKTDIEFAKNIGIKGILYNKNSFNWSKIKKKIIYSNEIIKFNRITKETNVLINLNINKYVKSKINTGIKFLDHMLEQFSFHAKIYLFIKVIGDLHIDDHHTIEDVAISLGRSILTAVKKRKYINRFGLGIIPMDESISKCVLDISGRPYIKFNTNLSGNILGDLNLNMIKHFFYSLSYSMKSTIHFKSFGENDHHICESIFKSFGVAFRKAIFSNCNNIPSTKGVLL